MSPAGPNDADPREDGGQPTDEQAPAAPPAAEPAERWAAALRVYRRLREGLPQQSNSGPGQGS